MRAEHTAPKEAYANYGKYYVRVDKDAGTFTCGCEGYGDFWRDVRTVLHYGGKDVVFGTCTTEWRQPDFEDHTLLTVRFTGEVRAELVFKVRRDGVYAESKLSKGVTACFCGRMFWGDPEDCFAVRLCDNARILRSGVGPAVSADDNALFDRGRDAAVVFGKGSPDFSYDWEQKRFTASLSGKRWQVGVRERIYEDIYHMPYKPIRKQGTFPTPPVGWMTWYSVQFDACEEIVLQNAARMKELFGDFGASAVWVDWEWYNSSFHTEGPKGIDYFHPDPVRYPHGMQYVADRVTQMGLTPALWIGITHEPGRSEFIEAHPDTVLCKEDLWCGEYIFDVTDETYRREYVPKAIEAVRDWHYRALKWDCLPITLWVTDRYHESLRDPSLTSETALRRIVETARAQLGDDFYMLSCAGAADREIRFAADLFDGARIGGDIFTWKEFIEHLVSRVMRLYLYHNVLFYCDPDNVVIREEFNNFEQAVSRASFVSCLGLPFTMGDDLTKLPDARVEILRRCIPPLDAHPCDIGESACKGDTVVVNQCVAKPFEQWNVVDVLNLAGNEGAHTVKLRDLGLTAGKYLLFEFWSKEFCGICEDAFTVALRPYQSKVYAVRKLTGVPQIVCTSRHISAGGVDLCEVHYDENARTLSGVSQVVKGDEYVLYVYNPYTESIVTKSYMPCETGKLTWKMTF